MVLVLVLLLTQAAQQTPPRDATSTAASGTAVIAGRVVDAETGAPIGGATLQIGPVKIGERPTPVEAGPRGEFRLTGLAAGDYTIVASPSEFRATHVPQMLNNDFSALMTGRLVPSVQLKKGEVRDDVVIRLPRAQAIDGMVVDEFGEPMANVHVSAEIVEGLPLGSQDGSGQATDDRGLFRLFGLAAGTYRVCASPTRDWRGPSPTAGDTMRHPYVKTCYPSSSAGGGERLTVSGSTPTPMLTVVMQRLQAFTITGLAISASGAKNLHVSIQKAAESERSTMTVNMQEGGRFTVRGVPPGTYTLSAWGESRMGPNEYVNTEYGRATVTVEGSDIAGVEIVTSKGATVVGRIVPVEPLPSGTSLRVERSLTLSMIHGPGMGPLRSGPVGKDLTFEMTGIHGEVLFEVSGLPEGWVVTAVRYRGADVTDTSVRVETTTQPSELEVHISPRSGQIVARAVSDDGALMPGAIALLMPAKGDRFPLPAFGASKPREGGLDVWHVRPVEHLIVAVTLVDLMQVVRNPAKVAALRQTGRLVRVAAGERVTVDVVVRPLPEAR